jgi:DNA-binding MarR family transcriptional regulator
VSRRDAPEQVVPRFDEEIHAPLRLRICALLGAADEIDFTTLRERLEVSDSVLSKHLSRLESGGYLTIRKATERKHVRTWVGLTEEGRSRLRGHLAALRDLADQSGLM